MRAAATCASARCAGDGAAVEAPLCAGCLDRAEADIRALRDDHARLRGLLVPGQGGMRAWVSGGGAAGVPIALHIEALRSDIAHGLTTWEPAVREAAGLPAEAVGPVREGWAVAAAVRVIAPRVAILASLPPVWTYAEGVECGPVERDGVWAVARLRRLHGRARATLGTGRLIEALPGECSRCGATALRRADGTETVWCDACDQRWTWDDYRRYVGLMLTELGASS